MKSNDSKPIIVLVSAYSTGRFLPYLFRGNGYECLHINAHPEMPEVYTGGYSENQFLYRQDIMYDGCIDSLLDILQEHPIKFVIPASESGVLLADTLNERLGLSAVNDYSLSAARRDKYLMQQELKKNNLNFIPTWVIGNEAELRSAASKVQYPVVLKPLASSDAEGVAFCFHQEHLEQAFLKIKGNTDLYSQSIDRVLLQKKMVGKEFVVNTVSWEGKHIITDIWSNDKLDLNGEIVYDFQDLIAPWGDEALVLASYICSVLDVLGVRFGAGHSEVILTDTGPVLIELGARLAGAFDPSSTIEALGYSQLSVLANSYLNPSSFVQCMEIQKHKIIKKNIKIVSLISNKSGIIKDLSALKFFYQLQGFFSLNHSLNVGGKLQETTNLTNSPGNVYLIAKDKPELDRGFQAIRMHEKAIYSFLLS